MEGTFYLPTISRLCSEKTDQNAERASISSIFPRREPATLPYTGKELLMCLHDAVSAPLSDCSTVGYSRVSNTAEERRMTAIAGLTPAQLADLAKFDTPTICNVVELFDVRPRNAGYMNDTIKACFPRMPPMVGYALTSFFRSLSPPRGGDIYANLTRQVECFGQLPGPPVLVFQDVDGPVAAATFGEVMCTTYKAFGAKGLITSGTGRDLDQVERINFPAFTSGTACRMDTLISLRSAYRSWSAASRSTRVTCSTATSTA